MFQSRPPTPRWAPFARLRQRLRALPSAFADALDRRPVSTIMLLIAAVGLPWMNAQGLAGGFGIPIAAALPLGIAMIAWQVEAFLDWRNRTGNRLACATKLAAVSTINMLSFAAGLVAANPDALGRRLVERELAAPISAAQHHATRLETAADRFDELAAYSRRQAAIEGATDQSWRPTCPNSQGPGPGQVNQWRGDTADVAATSASTLRTAASSARAAAKRAEDARAAYGVEHHPATMTVIAGAVAEIDRASGAAERAGVARLMTQLEIDGGPSGVCPDATLLLHVQNVTKALPARPAALAFSAPPKPDEQVAVRDLVVQILALPSGRADLSLYGPYMAAAPLLDLTLMGLLASVLLPVVRDFHREAVRRLGLPEEFGTGQLDLAYRDAARDPQWTALAATEKLRRRWFTIERHYVPEDDAAALAHARDLVASSVWREGAGDGTGNIVFILRPRFRPLLWTHLVHRHAARQVAALTDVPILTIAEN